MISCKDCATQNSIDSAFCKKCGKPLAQEEALDARESLDKQLDHGFELFHHGRTDEAWLNVEACLIADPENLRALSLKGLILERRGLIFEALDCYETIVRKDPNAALERMKLQTLRGMLDVKKFAAPGPDKRIALGIAVCVTLLVVCLAGAIALSRKQQTPSVVQNEQTPSYQVDSFPQTPAKPAANEDQQAGEQEAAPTNSSQDTNQSQENTTGRSRVNQSPINGALPDPTKNENTQQGAQEFKPVNPLENAQIQPIQNANTVSTQPNTNSGTADNGQSGDPDPSAVGTGEEKPAGPPPLVDIKLSDSQSQRHTESAVDANGLEALVRTARGQYQVGSYQAAATTYEKALAAGADPALINQRLAQCYERLGRTSDAKDAYGRAINAIQTQINGGKGNKDRLLAALNSSQQALKNLQGG